MKDENYLSVDRIAGLDRDGYLLFVKYAIVRDDPAVDAYLETASCRHRRRQDRQRHRRTADDRPFPGLRAQRLHDRIGLVAPANSMRLLRALKAADYAEAERIRQTFLGWKPCATGMVRLSCCMKRSLSAGSATWDR